MRYIKLSVFIFCFQLLKSQNFYIETNNGYGISFMNVLLGKSVDTSNTTTLIYGTYGTGANFNLGAGYMFNQNIGVELMFSYVHGKKTLTNDIKLGFSEYRTDYARMFIATPMFVAKSNGEKFNIIGKLGLVVPFAGHQISEALSSARDVFNPTIDSSVYFKIKTYGKPALGGFLSLGAEYSLSSKISLTVESQMFFLHVKSHKSKLLAYKVYGVDKYSEWEQSGNTYETHFVDSYSSPLKKGESPSLMSSYSALRFNVGFKYYFGK